MSPPRATGSDADPGVVTRSAVGGATYALGSAVLQVVSLACLARLLSPTAFGLGALAVAFIYTVGLIVDGSLGRALVQRERLETAHVDTAFWLTITLAGLSIAAVVAGAESLAASFGRPELAATLRWASLILPFSGVNGVIAGVLNRRLRFSEVAGGHLVGRLAGSLIGVGLAWWGWGAWSLVWLHVGSNVATTIVLWSRARWKPGVRVSVTHMRQLARFAGPSAVYQAVVGGDAQILSLLVAYLFGPVALGGFTLASRVTQSLSAFVQALAHQINLPILARQQGDAVRLRGSIYDSAELTCVFVFPIFACLVACAEEIVVVLFGEAWEATALLVRLLGVACALSLAGGSVRTAIDAIGRPGWHVVRGLIGFAVSTTGLVVLALILQPAGPTELLHAGSVAIGLAWLLRVSVTLPLDLYVAGRLIGTDWRTLAGRIGPPLAASVLMMIILLAVRAMVPAPWGVPISLVLQVLVGAVGYAGGLVLLDRVSGRRVYALAGALGAHLCGRRDVAGAGTASSS